MKNWDIKTRVLILALLPSIFISSLLGCYFTIIRFRDLELQLHNESKLLIRELGTASQYGLYAKNYRQLQGLANSTITNPNIDAVTVYNNKKAIVAYAGPDSLRYQVSLKSLRDLHQSMIMETQNNFIITKPVIIDNRNVENLVNSLQAPHSNQLVDALTPRTILGWVSINFDPASIRLAQYQTIITSACILFLAIIIGILLAWRIGRDITEPLSEVTEAVKKIKDGKLNTKVKVNGGGQLSILATGINSMSENLRRSQQELQQNIEQATRDLTESLETVEIQNIELNMARKDALEASRVKSEFIANISHEIRTPMNSIIGFTNLLLESELSPHQRDYLITIKKSASNLLDIINDILDFSKIEAGKLRLHYIPMSIQECIDDVFELLAPNAHAKQIELLSEIAENIPQQLIGDPLRLKQVIINLVGNAIKFTERGHVAIAASLDKKTEQDHQIRITISDTGPGLTVHEQKQLFRAFGQADSTVRRKYGGTGLGLVISKKLVTQMGGTIGVNSQPGQGSSFWFTFLGEASQQILNDSFSYNRLDKFTIILFESQPRLKKVYEHCFKQWGIKTISVSHEQDFIAALAHPHDLIIIGINQPYIGLKQLFDNMKAQCDTPFIILVNTSSHELIREIKNQGAAQCLSKPITQKKLYHELCKVLLHKASLTTSIFSQDETHPPSLIKSSTLAVLAVDDNPANLKLLCVLLEKIGANVTKANSGYQALEMAAEKQFDIILMDIQMPKLDGIETTQRIRNGTTSNRNTPVIAISAHVIGHERDSLIAAGINDYLSKPITQEQLFTTLEKWCNENNAQHAKQEEFESSDALAQEDNDKAIDMTLATKLAGSDQNLARELLEMLLEKLPSDKQMIMSHYQQQAFDDLQRQIHKLHGAACYCGVPRMKRAAFNFETALKNKHQQQYDTHFQTLITEINAVIEQGKEIIGKKIT